MRNQIQLISDDNEAKAFLASEGMLQSLVIQDPYDHAALVFATEDAYCLATNDTGHPNQEDNGYTVLCIGKDAMSRQDAARFIAEARDAGKLYPETPTLEIISENEPAYN
jgi:hypothetical protein